MVIVPPILGMVENWKARQLVLFALWFIGYFLFYSATVWLRSRMKKRYLPPVVVYGVIVSIAGVATLFLAPYLLWWALIYAPLMAFAAWEAWRRKERSLASGIDTLLAACLLIPMMYDVGSGAFFTTPLEVWLRTASVFGYFAGTVLYVKTNIRERASTPYFVASVVWHAVWVVIAAFLAILGVVSWAHVIVWVAIAARAYIVPDRVRRTRKAASVKAIGIGEIVSCLAFALTLLIS